MSAIQSIKQLTKKVPVEQLTKKVSVTKSVAFITHQADVDEWWCLTTRKSFPHCAVSTTSFQRWSLGPATEITDIHTMMFTPCHRNHRHSYYDVHGLPQKSQTFTLWCLHPATETTDHSHYEGHTMPQKSPTIHTMKFTPFHRNH